MSRTSKTYASVAYVGPKHQALEAAFREASSELAEAARKSAADVKEAEKKAATILEDAKKRHAQTLKEAEEQAKKITDESAAACKVKEDALAEREAKATERDAKWQTIEHSMEQFKGRVKLNVGGHKYETTRSTLAQHAPEGMLAIMFSGRHAVDSDERGYVFIDRDGTHFGTILNFMRTGKAAWSNSNAEHNDSLREELSYYMVLEEFDAAATAAHQENSFEGQRKGVQNSPYAIMAYVDEKTRLMGFDQKEHADAAWAKLSGIRRIMTKMAGGDRYGAYHCEVNHSGPNVHVDDKMRAEFQRVIGGLQKTPRAPSSVAW